MTALASARGTDPGTADGELALRLDRLLADDLHATDPAAFLERQFDLGLAWVHFPEGRGGLGASPAAQAVVAERLEAVGAPLAVTRNVIGHGMVAPTLVAHGTPEQASRFLRPLFTGAEVWCQLFSEPGAGSDVAALATSARPDGEEWVVNGQKVWTTLAHRAAYGLLIARTDPDLPKHAGLTAFLLPMASAGVEVRPLFQMTGHAEFNEVYLTDVRIPDALRLGPVGQGWAVVLTTLMHERVAIGGRTPARGSGRIAELLAAWVASGRRDPARRDQVAARWIEAEVVRLTNVRARQLRAAGTPGPEGSIGKAMTATLHQRISELTVDLQGAAGMLKPTGYPMVRGDGTLAVDQPVDVFLRMRATSIEGGTSEIAKNILGERVLGLPPEPRADKGVPWRAAPRS